MLADALVELGETRGELIALQCALQSAGPAMDAEARAHAKHRLRLLVEQHWDRWLGPLAPYLHREGTAFRRGMLENIHVGLAGSPADGWREVAGHHELCAVHTVRPHRVSPEHYALFVAGLARPPRRLSIEGPLTVQHLATHARTLPIEAAVYAHRARRAGGARSAHEAAPLARSPTRSPSSRSSRPPSLSSSSTPAARGTSSSRSSRTSRASSATCAASRSPTRSSAARTSTRSRARLRALEIVEVV